MKEIFLAQFLITQYDKECTIVRLNELLFAAATQGLPTVVQFLLERGASVTTTFNAGWTALHIAAYNGSEAVVKLLLTRPEIDIHARTASNDATAIDLARSRRHDNIVQLLTNHAQTSPEGENALRFLQKGKPSSSYSIPNNI